MKFKELFGDAKPVMGMIHLNTCLGEDVLTVAKREIEIYFENSIYPLVENYFGSASDCEKVLAWLHAEHPDRVYGVNVLGDTPKAFELAARYGARFVQVDSVCGHLPADRDEEFACRLASLRREADVVLLGGVRFKYQPVKSGRTLAEDLRLGAERCDAVVCTGEGTGLATPLEKVACFRETLGDFPVMVGAGVTAATAAATAAAADGVIVGSWLKRYHRDKGSVAPLYVKEFMAAFRRGDQSTL